MPERHPVRQGAAAVQLRVSGASFETIATTLGLSGGAPAALRVVTDELASHGEDSKDARERLRAETNMVLDAALHSCSGKAMNPEHDEHLVALRTLITVLDRRAKLNGLDAPTEMIVHNPTQTEIDQWVASMVQQTMPDVDEDDDIIEGEVISESFVVPVDA